VFWTCVLVCTYLCLVLFSLFCIFILGYGSSAPNEDVVRFRCRGSHIPFFHFFFVKIFKLLCSFLGFGIVCAFLIGF